MNEIYVVLGADNIGYDIYCKRFNTYEDAYEKMRKEYEETKDLELDGIEEEEIHDWGAHIICDNADTYYWQIKKI